MQYRVIGHEPNAEGKAEIWTENVCASRRRNHRPGDPAMRTNAMP